VSFREPEGDADLEAIGTWAFETARGEPLKYATWLALNAVADGVTGLQGLLEPRGKAVEDWACEATQGGEQFADAAWLALDATVNGLCSLQDKFQPAEQWDRIKRIALMKDQRQDRRRDK
jgi:hypothetical protein